MKKNLKNFFIFLTLTALIKNQCSEGCLKCTSEDKCEMCDTTKEYKINIDKCEKVTLENCIFINQAGECLACSSGFYIESTSRKCIAIDKPIENCQFYDSSQSCSLCKTDFYLDGLKCTVVEKKIANCMYYVLDEQCSDCSQGFLMDFDTKTCSETSSIANCSYFSRVKCEGCSGGFIKNENIYFKELFKFSSTAEKDTVLMMIGQRNSTSMATQRICEKTSLSNCAEYETFDKCKVCAEGHFLSEIKVCTEFPLPVISNCQRYSSNTNCIECVNQFYLKNSSTCTAVTDIENCSEFDGTSSSSKCKLCKDDYYLSGSTTCKLRENIIDKCDSLNSSDSCLKCADNFEKTSDSLKCLPIVADCKEYSSSSKTDTELTCSVCKDAFILDGVECKAGTISGCAKYTTSSTFGSQTCDLCNNQFWLDDTECKQIDPISNCLNYHTTKDKSCIECEEGNFNFQIESVCKTLTPIINCSAYTQNSNPLTCETCLAGFIPNSAKSLCVKINITNCSFGSDADNCTICKENFALGLNICNPIFDYMGKNCQVSDINTKNNAQVKTVLCKECKINSIPLDHNTLAICVKKENLALHFTYTEQPNCTRYSATGLCTNCVEGKFLSDEVVPTCEDTCSDIILRYDYTEAQRNLCSGSPDVCSMMSNMITGVNGCVKCSTGNVILSDFDELNYTNVKPEMGSEIVDHPRAVFFKGTCVAVAGKTFNEGHASAGSEVISNCLYYRARGGIGGANKLDCIRCKDFHTGVTNNINGSVINCVLDTDFEDGAKRYGLDVIWEKLFSSYVCKGSGTIPFVAYEETSSSNPTPTGILGINPADKPVNGTVKKSNFCSLAVSDATANQSTAMVANCGMGAYRFSNSDTSASDVTYHCAACKPGYEPTATLASYSFIKTTCEEISNCTGTEWFNSCSQCAENNVYKYETNNINYTICTAYTKNENCYAAEAGGDCKICKKGYNLNADKLCDSYTPPNCASSTAFNTASTFVLTNAKVNLKSYLFYKYQDNLGCGTCKSGFTLKQESTSLLICTESEYIKTKGNEIDNASSVYIQYCESYSYVSEFLCNKCKAGKLLVVAKDKCVAEITDCVLASDTANQCNTCKEGYALKNNLCVNGDIENCDSYFNQDNNTELICKKCSDGYFKESDDTKCTKCLVDNCKTPTSLRKCSACMSGFINYQENDYDYCFPLSSEYQCTAATISNSAEYGATIACDSCELTNDIIVTNASADDIPIKTICLGYNKTENCETHTVTKYLETTSFHCNKCEDGYFLNQDTEKCTERVNKPSDCIIYNPTEDKCSTCSESTFEEEAGKKCKSFPVGIVGCNNYTSSSSCTGCMTDMYLSGKSCVAIAEDALIKDCEFYQNATTCKTCKTNFFLSSNTCTKANVTNCIKLISIDICEICKPGYGIKETAGKKDCVSVNSLKCLSFTPKEPFPCLICEEDYYPDTDGKCVKANPLITDCVLYKDNSTCVTCKAGSVLSLDKKMCSKGNVAPFIPEACQMAEVVPPFCVTCAAGFFMSQGGCSACGSNGVASGCFACDPFMEEKCIVCMSDYWMNKDGVCTAVVKPNAEEPEEESFKRIVGLLGFFILLGF